MLTAMQAVWYSKTTLAGRDGGFCLSEACAVSHNFISIVDKGPCRSDTPVLPAKVAQDRTMGAFVLSKKCTKCGGEKPLSEFYRDRQKKDGYTSACRACIRLAVMRWQTINHEKKVTSGQKWIAANRARMKSLRRIWWSSHPEKREESREWAKANCLKRRESRARRRAREKANGYEKIDYAAILERDRWVCHICKKKVTKNDLSFDHLIPIACGGAHTKENLRVAHGRCNSQKGISGEAQLLLFG